MQSGCPFCHGGDCFSLSGADDKTQMDDQLLWVSEPREVGVTEGAGGGRGGVGMRVRGAPLHEGTDLRLYF